MISDGSTFIHIMAIGWDRFMADKTAIEWTDATWNPVSGCTKVSPGCAHCYAEAITLRFRRGGPFLPGKTTILLHQNRLSQPERWRQHILQPSGELRPHVLCLLNDESLLRASFADQPVADGDEILIHQAISGG